MLANTITVCNTLPSRTRGLMFHAPLKKGEAFLFTFPQLRRVWIHMLFVFFPVDMVFLDSAGKVVHLIESARPFRLRIVPPVPISILIELPAGAIKSSKTRLGDSIQLNP